MDRIFRTTMILNTSIKNTFNWDVQAGLQINLIRVRFRNFDSNLLWLLCKIDTLMCAHSKHYPIVLLRFGRNWSTSRFALIRTIITDILLTLNPTPTAELCCCPGFGWTTKQRKTSRKPWSQRGTAGLCGPAYYKSEQRKAKPSERDCASSRAPCIWKKED